MALVREGPRAAGRRTIRDIVKGWEGRGMGG
jgi:hypothetical protein